MTSEPTLHITQPSTHIYDAFFSHASQDSEFVSTVAAALHHHGFKTWIDNSSLGFGTLLRDELRSAIENSRVLILFWSQAASQSRWVLAEIFTAFHLNRFIIPCMLDNTPLPQFLQNTAWLNRSRDEGDIGVKLSASIQAAPSAANSVAPWLGSRTDAVLALLNAIGAAQIQVVMGMTEDFQKAARNNDAVRSALESAMELARYDPFTIVLTGYQCKNDYMFAHWDEIQAGRAPHNPLLMQGERHFFDALCINPSDVGALNGIGTILMFERELDAAEFFQRRAIDIYKAATGRDYEAAQQDLDLVLYYKQRQTT